MPHMNSLHQPCDVEHCTEMILMPTIMLIMTPIMPQPNYINCIGHLPNQPKDQSNQALNILFKGGSIMHMNQTSIQIDQGSSNPQME